MRSRVLCCRKILELNFMKFGADSSKVRTDTDTGTGTGTDSMAISDTYFVFNLSGEVG